ncbi:MAG: tRNA 2-thiouridine(34) synthase MnmA [Oscillospiraceae bacterium]|jgi:tRNA-specific 2-thiouridylase|nr:tRNA 2-thiouridine(34) synthase MnmA [Oscillospiraceae bacterium]
MASVLVAMSGGVDSSCSVALLLQKGYDVVGATFKLFEPNATSLRHLGDAASVAKLLRVNHLVFDFIDDFKKKVMDYFVKEYLSGKTPNPCVVCNKNIKFGKALERAQELGFDFIATGHYARVEFDESSGRFLIKKSLKGKDQSYCLYTLNQKQISRVIFPLGGFEKSEVRSMAKDFGIGVHNKPDSQDICFISGNHYDFIKYYLGEEEKSGNFVDESGIVLGKHKGISRYTVGQRRGIGIALGERAYIKKINPIENTITLAIADPPRGNHLVASDLNFIPFEKLTDSIRVTARTRYNCKEVSATVLPISEHEVKVIFDENIEFIAPGQSVTFYDGDILVGGGVIN